MAAADFQTMGVHELRCTLDALYADYAGCLNDEAFEQWPNFFTADCVYRMLRALDEGLACGDLLGALANIV